jgi:hypothetical protein
MLSITPICCYAQCHYSGHHIYIFLCWMPLCCVPCMVSIIYTEHQLWWVPFILRVAISPLWWVSLCWVSQCWMPLSWVSLGWWSWRPQDAHSTFLLMRLKDYSHIPFHIQIRPVKPYWGERLSTIDHHVVTSLDRLLFILKVLFIFVTKRATLKRRSTVK